ncbi:hypothetical protein Cgig2_013399 [Carnegiea gigantea]|uniref:Uncharacterized protein n=1 Tax=Carnegiea gigantea TaxID=171969 RepID=A0A9Q1KDJ4_9CARY|nr:hypothetical protein Cgig2_013399 [Carnegiea gigantea]
MGFPRSLTMDEMTLYVLGNFEWYRKKVVFPPRPLPSDYEELCTDFVLAEAEEYAWDYEIPELPQVVFLAMLLNDTMKLGVLCGWMIGVMESALKELRWSTFQAWVGRNSGRILEAHWQEALNDSEEEESSGLDNQNPLSKDHWDLCLSFTLPDTEEARRYFNIPEIMQATCYAMLLNDAVGLSLVSGDMARGLKATLEGLRGLLLDRERDRVVVIEGESNYRYCIMVFPYFLNTKQAADFVNATFMWCMRGYVCPPQLLLKDYRGLCPDFNLEVAEAFAKDVHIPELAHATFYAMVLNDALALGVECVYMTDALIPHRASSRLRQGDLPLVFEGRPPSSLTTS